MILLSSFVVFFFLPRLISSILCILPSRVLSCGVVSPSTERREHIAERVHDRVLFRGLLVLLLLFIFSSYTLLGFTSCFYGWEAQKCGRRQQRKTNENEREKIFPICHLYRYSGEAKNSKTHIFNTQQPDGWAQHIDDGWLESIELFFPTRKRAENVFTYAR